MLLFSLPCTLAFNAERFPILHVICSAWLSKVTGKNSFKIELHLPWQVFLFRTCPPVSNADPAALCRPEAAPLEGCSSAINTAPRSLSSLVPALAGVTTLTGQRVEGLGGSCHEPGGPSQEPEEE